MTPRCARRPLALALAGVFALPLAAAADDLPQRSERILHVPPLNDLGAVFMRADELSATTNQEVEGRGNVELRTRARTINADHMRYDTQMDELYAEGHVRMRNRLNQISGPEMLFRRETSTGYVNQPEFSIGINNSRGDATELIFAGPDEYKLYDARYTTCRPDSNDWYLKVSDLNLDQSRHVGTAHNATVYFEGWPILYSPWADFPLDNQRKSGLLTPAFGSTGKRGFEMLLPYYWNIAPNYDATFTPRVMTKRGIQLDSQFRYLRPDMVGSLDVEVLPHDRITGTNRNELALVHTETFMPGLTGGLNLNRVSDDTYFVDLADRIAVTSQTTLPREGYLSYNLPYVGFTARVQRFQTLQDPTAPIVPPYERLPQLLANSFVRDWHGFELSMLAEYDKFEHPTMITGQRFIAYPSMSFPVRAGSYFITPKIGVHYADYNIDESSGDPHDTTRALYQDSSVSIPIVSLDSGLVFERDWTVFGRPFLNTLEPRMFFLYVPYRKQDQFPNFDSALADFNFAQLFSENRYVGNDRVGDARQMTLAVSSRLLEPDSGDERLRVALGQRYYFNDQKVTLNEPLRTDRRSDYLLTGTGRITDAWLADSGVEYNPYAHHAEQFDFGVRYQPQPGKILGVSYRYVRELIDVTGPTQIKQWDIVGQWPIYAGWSAEARWNYSLYDHKVLEAVAGVEYNGGCWVFRIIGQRIATTTQSATSSVFLQLELNGLGRLGTNPLELLRRNIPGYYKVNEAPPLRDVPGQWYEPNY
jgi:LPS-assembly protein